MTLLKQMGLLKNIAASGSLLKVGTVKGKGLIKSLPYPTEGLQVLLNMQTYEDGGTTYYVNTKGTDIPLVSGTGIDAILDFSVLNDDRFDKSNATYWGATLDAYFYFDALNPTHAKLKDFHYRYFENQMASDSNFVFAKLNYNLSKNLQDVEIILIYSNPLTGNNLSKARNYIIVQEFDLIGYYYPNEFKPFQIKVDTTKAGSASDTMVIPLSGAGYDFTIEWGDGFIEDYNESLTSVTHTYTTGSVYEIKITGIAFGRVEFANAGDKLKLLEIQNWGDIVWGNQLSAFFGCTNMDVTANDYPNLTNCTTLSSMFRDCSSLTYIDVSQWDVSNVNNAQYVFFSCILLKYLNCSNWDTSNFEIMYRTFRNCPQLITVELQNWDTSKVRDFRQMLAVCGSYKESLAGLEVNAATDMSLMLDLSDINEEGNTLNYDNTLISWANQTVNSGVTFSGGNSQCGEGTLTTGSATSMTANKLIDNNALFVGLVNIGDIIYNTTDETFAKVTAIDSDTQLSLSHDIMVSGENYRVQGSDAAKARASLILDNNWTITDGSFVQTFADNAKIAFTFDDGVDSVYNYIYPLFETKGIKGTFYVPTNWFGDSNRITWGQALEMFNDGHLIESHGKDHEHLTTLTESELNTLFGEIDTAFTNNGLPEPDHIAYPFGELNELVETIAASYYHTGRDVADTFLYLTSNLFQLPTFVLDIELNDLDQLDYLKNKVDIAVANKIGIIFNGHGSLPADQLAPTTPYNIQLEYLEELIDYIQSKDANIISMDQLYDLIK